MIELSNVSKKFTILGSYKKHKKRSSLLKSIVSGIKRQDAYRSVWALQNINIEIKKGEIIGLIGPNASGKTTLLRIIAGIYKPSSGTVRINGGVASVLRLDASFLLDLSVRDNIFLFAAMMGLQRREVNKKFSRIIDFAELNEFVNAELRTISSGMEARLTLSVVIQAGKDILLFDEAFMAGDYNFTEKCFKIIEEFKSKGKTIILSSHDLNIVRNFCDRVVLLEKGKLVAFAKSDELLKSYIELKR